MNQSAVSQYAGIYVPWSTFFGRHDKSNLAADTAAGRERGEENTTPNWRTSSIIIARILHFLVQLIRLLRFYTDQYVDLLYINGLSHASELFLEETDRLIDPKSHI